MNEPDTVTRELLLQALPAPAAEPYKNWGDVLERAEVSRGGRTGDDDAATVKSPSGRRWRFRPRSSVVFAIAAIAIALLATPAFGIASRIVDVFWKDGTPVGTANLRAQDRWLLEHLAGDGPAVERIASNGVLAYYLIRRTNGEMCLASGAVAAKPRLGTVYCSGDIRTLLPSAGDPLYTQVSIVVKRTNESRTFSRTFKIVGLADTGIDRINVLDANGNTLVSVPVIDHVFELNNLPPTTSATIAAIAADGSEVYRESIPARGGGG